MQPPTEQEIIATKWRATERLYGISKQQIPFALWDDKTCFEEIERWIANKQLPMKKGAIAPLTLEDLKAIKSGDWECSTRPINGTFEADPFGIWTSPWRICKIIHLEQRQFTKLPAFLKIEIYLRASDKIMEIDLIEGATCFLIIPAIAEE